MLSDFLLPVAACLVGLAVRDGYELLKKAGKLDTKNPVVLSVVMAAMTAFLASWIFMCPADPIRVHDSIAARRLGLGIAISGLFLAAAGLAKLKAIENIDHLVTEGLFAHIRHPMYTGFMLWICGWVLRSGSVLSAALAIICIANILYWRRLEDRALASRFGEEYELYRRRTKI